MKRLVAYFSASGITAQVAKRLADSVGADCYEICPKTPYAAADLDWRDEHSRSTLEMQDKTSRPEIAAAGIDVQKYDEIFVGFPIWWGVAPRIVNTFLESGDFTGKVVLPFATSGGGGAERATGSIEGSCPGAIVKETKLLPADAPGLELQAWAEDADQ